MAQYKNLAELLFNKYEEFREDSLSGRRIKHSDIIPLINRLQKKSSFSVKQVGASVQDRAIYLTSFGQGKTKVFLWSQMHGDESTATMALFDICNFFMRSDQFDDLRKNLLKKLTVHFIPMVNPDGAEVFERRNSMQIDINRDALRQQSPEGRILRETFNELNADYGFNLHDQSIYYGTGRTIKPAALSFLAPPPDYEKTITPARRKSMQLISYLYKIMSEFIPGQIGRYSDDYEPRAFGDIFQSLGTATTLIETGGLKNDPEKQFLRKLNFIALLSAFSGIAEDRFVSEDTADYDKIPLNREDHVMDLILRNLIFRSGDKSVKVDIGINRTEQKGDSDNSNYSIGRVSDLGDLSVFSGYEEYDLEGMEISAGKTYERVIASADELSKIDFSELHARGYTNIITAFQVEKEYSQYPINIVRKGINANKNIAVDGPANFSIILNGKVKFVIVNGYVIDIDKTLPDSIKGEVFR